MEVANRRPIKTRSSAWARGLAYMLARARFTPNAVSVIGVGFALVGAAVLVTSSNQPHRQRAFCLLVAAACIQLRLLCNMLDGLIGRKSKLGDLFNELPDRIEDVAFLLGAGYAAGTPFGLSLGWTACILAVTTAYVRLFGGSIGLRQDFCGPFAKPQRMFFLTITCGAAAAEAWAGWRERALHFGLLLIVVGTAVTVMRRVYRISGAMKAR